MINKRIKPAWLMYILIFCGLFAISGWGREDSFIEYLKIQFQRYNSNYNPERTYLMTDRFVYRPGEDLWFKGYVVSGNPGMNSEDFFIRLISDRGDEIIYRRYPIASNETAGRLVIPRSCIPGKYWLIAYTGWMKNSCPQEAFRKEILISKYFERRFQVETVYDKTNYKPGDTLNANIRIIDPSGRPVSQTSFEYIVETFKKSDIKGSGRTDIKGKSKINFIVPEQDELTMLTIEIRSRRVSGDYSMIIPTNTSKISVKFYPEGGSLIAGLNSLMAFKTTDQYGLAQMIKGYLTDRSGNIFDTISTGMNGKGIFEYLPSNDTMFFSFEQSGKLVKYPLPVAAADGSIITYKGRDGDTARFRIKSRVQQSQKSFWIAVLNNRIVWSSVENFAGNKLVNIPLQGLPAGIMQVTVFDSDYNLIADRLIRIKNLRDELRVQMERQHYRNRQRVSFLVEYPEKMKESSLALSVSLENLAHHKDDASFQDVFTQNTCFSNAGRLSALWNDIDLVASDLYPVNWKEILTRAGSNIEFTNTNGLNGIVYDKKENIAPHAKVRITHFPNFRLYETQTNEEGLFRISFGSDIIDYKFLNIDAYDALGKTNLNPRIDYTYVEELQKSIIEKGDDSEKERAIDLEKYGEPELVYDLRYGPGKFRKSRTDTRKKYDPHQYANYTDIMDIIQDIEPYRLLDNKMIFEDRNRSDSVSMPEAIIVINGALKGTNIEVFKTIIPSDITNINISDAMLDIRKYTPLKFSAVIEITTIQGLSRYNQDHIQTGQGILNSDKQFYSPDYAVESSYSADNRKTLYWNPKISVYKGNYVIVTFYTSDIKGTFYGHITGVDNEGNPFEKTFNFLVE